MEEGKRERERVKRMAEAVVWVGPVCSGPMG